MRCDANVSVRPRGQTTLGTKTEVKNMNSFRNVERALEYEINRQMVVIEQGGSIRQQTLLWDVDKQETRSMRSKEEAHDYRYYPDPDLVQVVVTKEMLDRVKADLPEMPEKRSTRFQNDLGLPAYDAELLSEERGIADYFEETLGFLLKQHQADNRIEASKAVSNFVMTDVMRILNEQSISIDSFVIDPQRLAGLITLRLENKVSSTGAQDIFNKMLEDPRTATEIAEAENLLQVSDERALLPVIEKVLQDSPKKIAEYKNGKTGLIGFFIGQVMRDFQGSPDPKLVRKMLSEQLESM